MSLDSLEPASEQLTAETSPVEESAQSVTVEPEQTATPEEELKLSGISVFFFVIFHIGAAFAPWCFSWSGVGVAFFLNWLIGGIGICLGYHRLLTHRSFVVPKPLEYFFATMGGLAFQGGPIFWVAAHRRHHLYTEHYDKDPYSASRGFWWSHLLWIFYPRAEFWDYEQYKKFAPDLAKDRYYRWLELGFLPLQVVLGVVLYFLGGWSWVVYGLFLRNVLERQATFFINSACHLWGYRTYECEDRSGNLWWAALITYGEGWHNNHHAFPNSAKTGMKWWEFDSTWLVIHLMQKVGLAQRVVLPSDRKAA